MERWRNLYLYGKIHVPKYYVLSAGTKIFESFANLCQHIPVYNQLSVMCHHRDRTKHCDICRRISEDNRQWRSIILYYENRFWSRIGRMTDNWVVHNRGFIVSKKKSKIIRRLAKTSVRLDNWLKFHVLCSCNFITNFSPDHYLFKLLSSLNSLERTR